MANKLEPGLSSDYFAHPSDQASMRALMEKLASNSRLRTQMEDWQADAEEEFYLSNLADNTKLSDSQGGSVYGLVRAVADLLGMPVPHVFLDTSPHINAFALGGPNPTIVLTSALIDTFPEPALRAVIGHELGHIICSHTFYRLLAEHFDTLSELVSLVPLLGPLLSMGMKWALFDWYRKSEFSADRAALLATQDLDAVQDCILRIAGGSSRLGAELTVASFTIQAKEFQERMAAKQGKNIQERIGFLCSGFMLQHAMSTHPWPAVRLQEISDWAHSPQYAHLLAGDYEQTLAEVQSPPDHETLIPPGEDIREYIQGLSQENVKEHVQDLGKNMGGMLQGLFKTAGR